MPRRGTDALAEYRKKRDFGNTPEPAPGPRKGSQARPRFVLQEHHARRLHWDLRLERNGALASWALPKGLPDDPRRNHLAVPTEAHPLEYLDFEGTIPKGEYGAGEMKIADRGTYECLKWTEREIDVVLHGSAHDARYVLFATDHERPSGKWLIHLKASPGADAVEPMPDALAPMLASAGELPEGDGWAYEVKWDGVRALAWCDRGSLRLRSRNLNDITATFPELKDLVDVLGAHRAVLDGEIVALADDGLPDFAALVQRVRTSKPARSRELAQRTPAIYAVFDLLWLDGHSLMRQPYEQRRRALESLKLGAPHVTVPESFSRDGAALLDAAAERGLEGVVAKRLDSVYEPGRRSRDWIKVKATRRQEFVVGGWIPQRGTRGRIGALLLGYYDASGELRYAGRVGSGLSEKSAAEIAASLQETRDSPFTGAKLPKDARHVSPQLVAEVRFADWTETGRLRHPVFIALRTDKDPRQVVREEIPDAGRGAQLKFVEEKGKTQAQIAGRTLPVSNLEKPLFPDGFTKRDVIEYYAAVAPVMLQHLAGRPVTLVRWPDGAQGKSFFQKQAPKHPDFVHTAAIETSDRTIDYLIADNPAALVWAANIAALELHVTLGRIPRIERALAVVFDLDPGEGTGLRECCEIAGRLHAMFEHLGLRCLVKTSGKKGLHVFLPLNGTGASYPDVKSFARTVAEMFAAELPERVVSSVKRSERVGKVLIDWRQNEMLRTEVAAYSLRAVEQPRVSTPVAWEEVQAVAEGASETLLQFTAAEVTARLEAKGDLLADALTLVQRLPGS